MEGFRQLIKLHLAVQTDRDTARKQDELRAQMKAMAQRVEDAKARLESVQGDVKRLQLERRSLEGDVGQLEQQRDRYRAQLMQAKTNDIYRTLLSEIETATRAISVKETGILEFMEAADTLSQQEASVRQELAEAVQVADRGQSRLAALVDDLEAERAAARARAAQLEVGVPPSLLVSFRRIGEARGGKGMALAVGHSCSECHVAVRPQVWVELVAREEGQQCAGCGRLLYREESVRDAEVVEDSPAAGLAG